jgi:acetyl esterase/lipase
MHRKATNRRACCAARISLIAAAWLFGALPEVSVAAANAGAPNGATTEASIARPSVSTDGTLHTLPLDIGPSQLWSPELRDWYAKFAVQSFEHPLYPIPDRDAPPFAWEQFRAWDEGEMAQPLAADLKRYRVVIEVTQLAGVHAAIITPTDGVSPENEHRVLINLRGGGFVLNPGLSFGKLESIPVAALGRIKVITLDYRQAPQHQYPAATEDVEAVYRELLKKFGPKQIGIYGCSAGGVLTAQAMAWFQSQNLPAPGAVGILCSSPGSKQQGAGDSRLWATAAIPPGQLAALGEMYKKFGWYMATANADDPKAYPGISDAVLAKFPPTLFLTGSRDPGSSAVFAAHARMLRLGVDSSLYVIEGAPHALQVVAPETPEAHDANAYIAYWFERHLAR